MCNSDIDCGWDIPTGDFNNVTTDLDSIGFKGPGTHCLDLLSRGLSESSLYDIWCL
jgi:hypothetical protein